ncbi:MAG: haloacid dehalogenase-like hydrolase, partial [Thermoleophilia bacterium]|nr:haloacid dehalogenase-like hydrolase [Thermoleophilia bacterium]
MVVNRLGQAERLALLDMDGVLVQTRFIQRLGEVTGRMDDLRRFLDNPYLAADERTQIIASLFAGEHKETFEEVARGLPLVPGAVEAVIGLRKLGYRVGIVTDSYQVAAEIVRRRVFADFTVAHVMRFRQGRATGDIMLSPAMLHDQGCTVHRYCKLNVMLNLCEKGNLDPQRVLAVGDGENDVCMLAAAGTSV